MQISLADTDVKQQHLDRHKHWGKVSLDSVCRNLTTSLYFESPVIKNFFFSGIFFWSVYSGGITAKRVVKSVSVVGVDQKTILMLSLC